MSRDLKVKIKVKSVFLFIDVLKKMEISFDDFDNIYNENDKSDILVIEDKTEKIGKQLIKMLLYGVDKAEIEVYLFLSNIFNVSADEVEELDLFEEIIPALTQYKGWASFLGKLEALK